MAQRLEPFVELDGIGVYRIGSFGRAAHKGDTTHYLVLTTYYLYYRSGSFGSAVHKGDAIEVRRGILHIHSA